MTPSLEILDRFQNWFFSQCDGSWEHDEGVDISTLDNPGWAVTINISRYDISDIGQERREFERGGGDWIHWWIDERPQKLSFEARCGATNLKEVLAIFLTMFENRRFLPDS